MISPNNQSGLQLVTEIQQKELLVNLILQLNKDFTMVGLDFNLSKESTPNVVVSYVEIYILNLIKKDFNSYVNLLYRIGVPEKQVREIKENDIQTISKKVAILILRKEWQKVFFRSRIQ